ncbi:TRAP transporter substrate-binding protein [Castellaniella sp.]|uniref:TRAP transporter substrate-binding protein n=1 Tax=Castellaniella sp. TaxID=1955812 RepID=UPI0035693DE7
MNKWLSICATAVALSLGAPALHAETTVRVGSIQSEEFYMNPYIKKFEEIVREKTDNAYNFKVYYNSTLGSESEMFEQMQAGLLDMMFGYSAILPNYVKETEIIGLPGLLSNFDEVHKIMNGPIGEDLAQKVLDSTGVRILWFVDQAHRNVFLKDKDVKSVADLKGIKLRSPNSPLYLQVLGTMGFNAAPMGFNEIYTAVQTGVVDGHEQEDPGMLAMKFYEVENKAVVTRHMYQSAVWEVSEKFFQKLPEKDRQIFIDAAREAGIWFRPLTGLEAELAARKELQEKHGVEVVELDQAELNALFEPMVDDYAKQRGIYDYVVKVREELGK